MLRRMKVHDIAHKIILHSPDSSFSVLWNLLVFERMLLIHVIIWMELSLPARKDYLDHYIQQATE